MGRTIHRCGDLYRERDGFADRYTTAPMTRAEMAAYLARTPAHPLFRAPGTPEAIEARLARADAQGTSATDDTRDATRWDIERCEFCEDFHHAFDPLPDGTCRGCDSPQRDRCHAAPCTARRRGGRA